MDARAMNLCGHANIWAEALRFLVVAAEVGMAAHQYEVL